MAAIITDTFRRNNAKLFISDIANQFNTDVLGHFDSLISNDSLTPSIDGVISPVVHTNKYYLGIGKSDKWPEVGGVGEEALNFNIPSPLGSFSDSVEVFNNLATLVLLGPTNTSIVIPNILWNTGDKYRAYDSYDSSCFYSTQGGVLPCYITVPDDGIYMCLKAPSPLVGVTSKPFDATSNYSPIATADGYVWVLVQKFTGLASEFITDQFVEVRRTALQNTNLINQTGPLTNCRTNSGGLVTGFKIINGGAGYNNGLTTAKLRGTDGLGFSNLKTVGANNNSFTVGNKTFTTNMISSATRFDVGQKIKMISSDSLWMSGTITSFVGATLIVNVASVADIAPGATGQRTSWSFEILSIIDNGVVISVVNNSGGQKSNIDNAGNLVEYSLPLDITVTSGSITSVSLKAGSYPTTASPNTLFPNGFLATSVEIYAGNGISPTSKAQIIPIVTPFNGFGYNPSDILPAWYAGISVSLNGKITQPGDLSPDNFYTPYRQISIIKNANASNQITVNALRSLTLTGAVPANFNVNANVVMTDPANPAFPLGIVDYVETVNGTKKLYFHQNYMTGYREIPLPQVSSDSGTITPATIKIGADTYNYNDINQSELSKITKNIHGDTLTFNDYPYYGEVIFVENRKKVERAINQNEKIKIIIQF